MRKTPLRPPKHGTTIGGQWWSVKRHPQLLETEKAEGICYPGEQKIVLDARLRGPKEMEVYLHELIEAINSAADLHMRHSAIQTLALLLSEAICRGQ